LLPTVDAGTLWRLGKSPSAKRCDGKRMRIYSAVAGSRLIYVITGLPDQLAFGFRVAAGKAAFLVNRMSVFIGLAAFSVNPLPAD
jgi:hypothetical protein